VNRLDQNETEFLGRVQALERRLQTLSDEQSDMVDALRAEQEERSNTVEYGHQNHVRNGDLHFTRNNYLYTVDFAGGTGEDANVSEEAAHIFAHPKDTAVDTTGSITSGTDDLVIDTPDFIAGDDGVEIVVYGAGVGSADLVTTINGVPGSATTCKLAVSASTTVTNARVRFRLLELKEDSTDENDDADLATNTALKTPAHTRYASTVSNPDYDKANGWIRWNDADNMLTFPLPYNILVPSKQYILTFIYKLVGPVDGEDEVFVDFFGGLWDNSPGRRQFLEGQPPELTATSEGVTGATTRSYMVLMYMSDGSTVATNVATVTDSNATLSTSNYVSLSWDQQPGVVRSEIYRNTGGTFVRLRTPYPAHTYYDTGLTSNSEAGFPTPTRERFIAKTQILETNFSPATTAKWELGFMNIVVPSTYDASGTTDKQWLCLGMNTGFSGTGDDHALLVDLISLDDKFGIFTRCPLDFQAKRGVTIGPSSGDQGTSQGGGVDFPGGGGCCVFSDLILTDQGEVPAINLVDNEHSYKVINRIGQPVSYEAEIVAPQTVYSMLAGEYKISGSGTHPVFQGTDDVVGKRLSRFAEGDIIETRQGPVKVDFLVKHFKQKHTIKITLKGLEKGFWQNQVAVHNSKDENI
jgi:hypothetical protein